MVASPTALPQQQTSKNIRLLCTREEKEFTLRTTIKESVPNQKENVFAALSQTVILNLQLTISFTNTRSSRATNSQVEEQRRHRTLKYVALNNVHALMRLLPFLIIFIIGFYLLAHVVEIRTKCAIP